MKQKLKYRFNNPNTQQTTVDYILKIFLESNVKKAEEAINKALKTDDSKYTLKGCNL